MEAIERAWKSFFLQFVPTVFTDAEIIPEIALELFPRITFSYSVSDYFKSTLTTFQVWTIGGLNNAELWAINDKIARAVPVECGATIDIVTGGGYEYRNPITGEWVEFEIEDFQSIVEQFAPPNTEEVMHVDWRQIEGGGVGAIEIHRGSPFLTPSPKDEAELKVSLGNLESRYLTTL